jgi:hypothetical protein
MVFTASLYQTGYNDQKPVVKNRSLVCLCSRIGGAVKCYKYKRARINMRVLLLFHGTLKHLEMHFQFW